MHFYYEIFMAESNIGLNFRNQLNSFYLCRFYLLFLLLSFQSYFSSLDAVISPLSVTISINISKAAIKSHYKKRLSKDTAHNNSEDKDNSHIFIYFFVLKMQIKLEALFILLCLVYTLKPLEKEKPLPLNKVQYLDYFFLKCNKEMYLLSEICHTYYSQNLIVRKFRKPTRVSSFT